MIELTRRAKVRRVLTAAALAGAVGGWLLPASPAWAAGDMSQPIKRPGRDKPAAAPNVSTKQAAAKFKAWGFEVLNGIERDFHAPNSPLYADFVENGKRSHAAFMWGCGVELSALAAGARADRNPRTIFALRKYADALDLYWQPDGPTGPGGYDVLPVPKPLDRYYDDNAWIVLGMMETFDATRDPKYLRQAQKTFKFVMSAEDQKLGGGLYWREAELKSKHTCTNGPAIVGALRLYQATRDQTYLATAKRLYEWTNANLQDSDGLYWDNIALDGKVGRTKFTYNTALMIRANCLLNAVTRDPKYLAEAQRVAGAAVAKWVGPENGTIGDTGKFAHMLIEAFLAVRERDHDPKWAALVVRCLTWVHENIPDPNGHYPDKWYEPQREVMAKYTLIEQASAARAYLVAAVDLAK